MTNLFLKKAKIIQSQALKIGKFLFWPIQMDLFQEICEKKTPFLIKEIFKNKFVTIIVEPKISAKRCITLSHVWVSFSVISDDSSPSIYSVFNEIIISWMAVLASTVTSLIPYGNCIIENVTKMHQ